MGAVGFAGMAEAEELVLEIVNLKGGFAKEDVVADAVELKNWVKFF